MASSAAAAIKLIKDQGEGTPDTPMDGGLYSELAFLDGGAHKAISAIRSRKGA